MRIHRNAQNGTMIWRVKFHKEICASIHSSDADTPWIHRKFRLVFKVMQTPKSVVVVPVWMSTECDCVYASVCLSLSMCMHVCNAHLYFISFVHTHKQFEIRIWYAYLLFHVRNSNGWMHIKWWVWCKAARKCCFAKTKMRNQATEKKADNSRIFNDMWEWWIRACKSEGDGGVGWIKIDILPFGVWATLLRVEYEIK